MRKSDALRASSCVTFGGLHGRGVVATEQHSQVVNSAEDQDKDATRHPDYEDTFQNPNCYDQQHGVQQPFVSYSSAWSS